MNMSTTVNATLVNEEGAAGPGHAGGDAAVGPPVPRNGLLPSSALR